MSTAALPSVFEPAVSGPGCSHGPILVMGVSGCGKSSVGAKLADYLDMRFIEGDSLHSPENVRKMRLGRPLDDEDRRPWLETIGRTLARQGDRTLLAARMAGRSHEYMPLSLLDSQLTTLELPQAEPDVVTIDINQPLEAIVRRAMTVLALRKRRTS